MTGTYCGGPQHRQQGAGRKRETSLDQIKLVYLLKTLHFYLDTVA